MGDFKLTNKMNITANLRVCCRGWTSTFTLPSSSEGNEILSHIPYFYSIAYLCAYMKQENCSCGRLKTFCSWKITTEFLGMGYKYKFWSLIKVAFKMVKRPLMLPGRCPGWAYNPLKASATQQDSVWFCWSNIDLQTCEKAGTRSMLRG